MMYGAIIFQNVKGNYWNILYKSTDLEKVKNFGIEYSNSLIGLFGGKHYSYIDIRNLTNKRLLGVCVNGEYIRHNR